MSIPQNVNEYLKNSWSGSNFLRVSFKLEVCLHLDESSLFEIKGAGGNLAGLIYCEDLREEHDPRYGTGRNIELNSDTRGAFRFTRIHLIMRDQPEISLEEILPAVEEKVLYSVNKFIDSYKLVTKRFGIENIFSLSEQPQINVMRYHPNQNPQGLQTIQFPGGITRLPLRSQEDIENIKNLTSQPIDLDLVEQFLLDAYKYIVRNYPLQALINAVTALQLKWKEFSPSLDLTSYKLTPKELKILKDRNKLGGKIDIVFSKILLGKLNTGILDSAKDGIKERNAVIHDGKRTLEGNARGYVDSLERVIAALVN